jgi:hypothetical protein
MRQSAFSFALAVLLTCAVGAVVLAQTHNNMTEKKATDEITFGADTKIGTHLLKAGRYEVSCNRELIKFSLITTRAGNTTLTKVLEVPCQGKELADKRETSQISVPKGPDGVPVLRTLLLRGSNIEHVFPN